MVANKQQLIYSQLDCILDIDELIKHNVGFNIKLKSSGFMDLSVEILEKTAEYFRISLTHYGELNGDLLADPDMEVKYNELEGVNKIDYSLNDTCHILGKNALNEFNDAIKAFSVNLN